MHADEATLDRARSLRTALDSLPEEQRNVVVMRHVIGLTPPEIAERMGRSESSIHGLHHRGRRALQQELRRLGCAPATARRRQLMSRHAELQSAHGHDPARVRAGSVHAHGLRRPRSCWRSYGRRARGGRARSLHARPPRRGLRARVRCLLRDATSPSASPPGTEALALSLRALEIGPGDEVIVPANSFIATAEAVSAVGAMPRLVDVDPDSHLLTPRSSSATSARACAA